MPTYCSQQDLCTTHTNKRLFVHSLKTKTFYFHLLATVTQRYSQAV